MDGSVCDITQEMRWIFRGLLVCDAVVTNVSHYWYTFLGTLTQPMQDQGTSIINGDTMTKVAIQVYSRL